jgi:hypothetical protein
MIFGLFNKKPKEIPSGNFETNCCFMKQITLNHPNGSVNISIQGKDGKNVDYVSKRIEEVFNAPKVDLANISEKFYNEMFEIVKQFNKGK